MNSASNQKRIAFGYNRNEANKIELHLGQAAAVELIYKSYIGGMSIAEIVGMLEGIAAPSPQNKPKWGKQAIANTLSNPHYLGDDNYPKIIDFELFNEVQELKAKRKPNLKA